MKKLIAFSLIAIGLSTGLQGQFGQTRFGQAQELPSCGSQEHTDKLIAFLIWLSTKASSLERQLYQTLLERHISDLRLISQKQDLGYITEDEAKQAAFELFDDVLGCRGVDAWVKRIAAILGVKMEDVPVKQILALQSSAQLVLDKQLSE